MSSVCRTSSVPAQMPVASDGQEQHAHAYARVQSVRASSVRACVRVRVVFLPFCTVVHPPPPLKPPPGTHTACRSSKVQRRGSVLSSSGTAVGIDRQKAWLLSKVDLATIESILKRKPDGTFAVREQGQVESLTLTPNP